MRHFDEWNACRPDHFAQGLIDEDQDVRSGYA